MSDRPIVLITGAAGGIGSSLVRALKSDYRVVGLDRVEGKGADAFFTFDITSDLSVESALRELRGQFGSRIASVVHLAAYFDFTGEDNPLYERVNVQGTRRLLRGLQGFEVEQFVYAGTMLVHAPCAPGQRIDESSPIAPKWAYPGSKAASEDVIRSEHGAISYVLLHLAGLYDDRTAVPTLAHQIARIYERDMQSHLYAGDLDVGQSFVHLDDMIDAFRRTIERRAELPPEATILIGEPDAMSYRALQDRLGELIHGTADWPTVALPKALAATGAWVQEKMEPIVPDAIDEGEKPFVRPFMVAMADDHYALDITRARERLGWEPRHSIAESLPRIVGALKADPLGWYHANKVPPPQWLEDAAAVAGNAELLRIRGEAAYRGAHAQWRWGAFMNLAMGTWLVTAPPLLGYDSAALALSDVAAGVAVLVLAGLSVSWRFGWARWACAAIGVWLMFAPLVFWTGSAAAYVNDTLVGTLVVGFAVLTRPAPGVAAVARLTGPVSPPGWDYSPSDWMQRLPIIVLAFIGLYVSRYLAAYQLGHIDGVWEPFFAGGPDPKNGTEEIITSSVSEAWPISDAGLGAVTYLLEILTGIIGSARRWRTMPWLVVLFGIMIVPLGVVSITFIVIQPIVIGTWCTLCLFAAAAMLVQIPYSLDELVATGQFLVRRKRAGASLLRIFFVGDTDEGKAPASDPDPFDQPAGAAVRDMLGGGVGLPWNLAICLAIGVWLMFTRLSVGAEDGMANADHLIGSLVLTVTVMALAEVARPLRFVNMGLGAALIAAPFVFGADTASVVSSLACGAALIGLSLRRGPIRRAYGTWKRLLV